MPSLITVIVQLLAVTFFIGFVGLPVWIIIYLLYQKKKTGSFQLKKLFIVLLITAVVIAILVIGSFIVLIGIEDTFGVKSNTFDKQNPIKLQNLSPEEIRR